MRASLVVLFWLAMGLACKQTADEKYLVAYNVGVNTEQDNYDIWVLDPDTGERRNITNDPDVAWTYTASGREILFISDRDSCPKLLLPVRHESRRKWCSQGLWHTPPG